MFADPHVRSRGMEIKVDHPFEHALSLIRNPLTFSGTPVKDYRAPPLLGAHTRDVLASIGYDEAKVETLKKQEDRLADRRTGLPASIGNLNGRASRWRSASAKDLHHLRDHGQSDKAGAVASFADHSGADRHERVSTRRKRARRSRTSMSRDPATGRPSMEIELYRDVMDRIRAPQHAADHQLDHRPRRPLRAVGRDDPRVAGPGTTLHAAGEARRAYRSS